MVARVRNRGSDAVSRHANKGKADRAAHINTIHSKDTILETHFRHYQKHCAMLHVLGGPVVHLTPHEYEAQKIAEAIERISAGVKK